MFSNEVYNPVGKAVFTGQVNAIGNMADDDGRAFVGINVFVGVRRARDLIFNEELWGKGFPHIVVERADAGEERIGSNLFSSLLGQVGDLKAVLVGPRGMHEDKFE